MCVCLVNIPEPVQYHIVQCTINRDHESLGFLAPYKPPKYLLFDNKVALVRHNQSQKSLQINSKPLH